MSSPAVSPATNTTSEGSQAIENWQNALEHYKHLMTPSACTRIFSQYKAFKEQTLPKIADEIIKAIPINESQERLYSISVIRHQRIQMLPDPPPNTAFAYPECNPGSFEADKIRRGVFDKLERMIEELDRIAPTFGYSKRQISIRIYEGLRSSQTQEKLFKKKYKEIKSANPSFSEEQVLSETLIWASPTTNNIPAHATGAAADLRLYDENKEEILDLGQYGVFWGVNPTSSTFSENITPEQLKNRALLMIAANNAGLVNYPYEYWHFSSDDKYAAYWENNATARYGAM